jgi:O-antigen biosynthesis protein
VPDQARKISPEGEVAPLPASRDEREDVFFGEDMVPLEHRRPNTAPEHQARYRWAASLLHGRSVLDVGCGTGAGSALLAEHAREVAGVDSSPPFVATATARHGERVEFRVGDASLLPFGDAEHDAVVCFETIEQVADLRSALEEMKRVLRPDGLLLISCANHGIYPPGNPLHRLELTSDEFRAAVERCFSNVVLQRQHRYQASLLGEDAVLALDDPAEPLEAELTKIVGTAPGRELYAVVLASDGELPPAQSRIALGGDVDQDEQRRLTASWRERAVYAETDAAAARLDIEQVLAREQQALERLRAAERVSGDREVELRCAREAVDALQRSASWRLTHPLRLLKRRALRTRDGFTRHS